MITSSHFWYSCHMESSYLILLFIRKILWQRFYTFGDCVYSHHHVLFRIYVVACLLTPDEGPWANCFIKHQPVVTCCNLNCLSWPHTPALTVEIERYCLTSLSLTFPTGRQTGTHCCWIFLFFRLPWLVSVSLLAHWNHLLMPFPSLHGASTLVCSYLSTYLDEKNHIWKDHSRSEHEVSCVCLVSFSGSEYHL